MISSKIYNIEEITIQNYLKYTGLVESVKYICEYSGIDPSSINIREEITNPDLPPEGVLDHNHIHGVSDSEKHVIGYLKFYSNYMNQNIIYLGDFFIHKNFQNLGHGKTILIEYEEYWRSIGAKKVVLNVDLRNWQGLRFWINRGYTSIKAYMGDYEQGPNTYAMLQLEKKLYD